MEGRVCKKGKGLRAQKSPPSLDVLLLSWKTGAASEQRTSRLPLLLACAAAVTSPSPSGSISQNACASERLGFQRKRQGFQRKAGFDLSICQGRGGKALIYLLSLAAGLRGESLGAALLSCCYLVQLGRRHYVAQPVCTAVCAAVCAVLCRVLRCAALCCVSALCLCLCSVSVLCAVLLSLSCCYLVQLCRRHDVAQPAAQNTGGLFQLRLVQRPARPGNPSRDLVDDDDASGKRAASSLWRSQATHRDD